MAGSDVPVEQRQADVDVRIETTQFIIDEILCVLGDTWAENEELKMQLSEIKQNAQPTVDLRAAAPVASNQETTYQWLTPAGILIVDSSKILQTRLRSVIEPLGYCIVGTANNGQQGADMAISQNPRLVILDYQLPVMNGLECLKAICMQRKDVKVIVCAAEITHKISRELIRHGVDAILTKPIQMDRFVETVKRLMGDELEEKNVTSGEDLATYRGGEQSR